MVQVYTGNGRGKTSAAVGLALRASAKGLQVEFIQFMKGDCKYGEIEALRSVPRILVRQFGRPDYIEQGKCLPIDHDEAMKALEAARLACSNNIPLLVLDEVFPAIRWGLLTEEVLLNFISTTPSTVELILTGRYANPRVFEIADLVTEMVEIKHYYQKGISSREGFDH